MSLTVPSGGVRLLEAGVESLLSLGTQPVAICLACPGPREGTLSREGALWALCRLSDLDLGKSGSWVPAVVI